jgi:hypothetical protein
MHAKPLINADIDKRRHLAGLDAKQLKSLRQWCPTNDSWKEVQLDLEHYHRFTFAVRQESPSHVAQAGRKVIKTCEKALAKAPASVSALLNLSAGLELAKIQIARIERRAIKHAPQKMTPALIDLGRSLRSVAIAHKLEWSGNRTRLNHWLREVMKTGKIYFDDHLWRAFVKKLGIKPGIAPVDQVDETLDPREHRLKDIRF